MELPPKLSFDEIFEPFRLEILDKLHINTHLVVYNNGFTVSHDNGAGVVSIVSTFSITQLPGCCGIGVSYHALIYIKYRNQGLGSILNRLRIELARRSNYGLLICSDIDANIPQNRILMKNGSGQD